MVPAIATNLLEKRQTTFLLWRHTAVAADQVTFKMLSRLD